MRSVMRRVLVTLVLALGTALPAEARNRTIAPPGNSGVAQYVESVPTAAGNRPTNTIRPEGGSSHRSSGSGGISTSGGSGGSSSGGVNTSGGSGGASSGGDGGAIAPSVRRALATQGPDGLAAAALAQATAAGAPRGAARPGGTGPGRTPHRSAASAVSTGAGSSPITALAKAVTGSTSNGGLGPLLPVVLIISLLGAAALALLRRRRTS
jgi:hypothetical protein